MKNKINKIKKTLKNEVETEMIPKSLYARPIRNLKKEIDFDYAFKHILQILDTYKSLPKLYEESDLIHIDDVVVNMDFVGNIHCKSIITEHLYDIGFDKRLFEKSLELLSSPKNDIVISLHYKQYYLTEDDFEKLQILITQLNTLISTTDISF